MDQVQSTPGTVPSAQTWAPSEKLIFTSPLGRTDTPTTRGPLVRDSSTLPTLTAFKVSTRVDRSFTVNQSSVDLPILNSEETSRASTFPRNVISHCVIE